jgi:hypothetical protein
MAIRRKVNSGIEINEAHRDEDIFPCSPTQGEVRHVGEMRATTKVSRMPQRLTFFSKPIPRRTKSFPLWIAFPPLRRWQATQPLHKLYEGDARASRSPLPKPSKRYKNHRRERGGSKLKRLNNGGQKHAQEGLEQWGRSPFYSPSKI